MKVNTQIVLNSNCELRVFYYNDDPNFTDHDTETPDVGNEYTIIGYVLEKSNKLSRDEAPEDFKNLAYVIRHNLSAELFRVEKNLMQECFVKK